MQVVASRAQAGVESYVVEEAVAAVVSRHQSVFPIGYGDLPWQNLHFALLDLGRLVDGLDVVVVKQNCALVVWLVGAEVTHWPTVHDA
jgi:hypothetical protein